MEPWEGIVKIPEGKVGDYEIKHMKIPAGMPVLTSNMRTAMYRGQADKQLVFDRETVWHEMLEDGGRWMSDLPIEQIQHDQELEGFAGRVLVGGLGIGYAVNALALKPEVGEIVVVEISPEVSALVGPHLRRNKKKVTLVTMDLFDYLRQLKQENEEEDAGHYFDWAFYDIWRSDGEGTFHEVVCPLRELSSDLVDNVVCWNESVMRGQLCQGLHSRWMLQQLSRSAQATDPGKFENLTEEEQAQFKESLEHWAKYPTVDQLSEEIEGDGAFYWNWAVPFWRAVKKGVVTADNFDEAAGKYAGTYGYEHWQAWWSHVCEGAISL